MITPPSPDWPADWLARMRTTIEEFGPPIYGLAGVGVPSGTVCQYGSRLISVRYQFDAVTRVEVTTARYPLGGTRDLMVELTKAAIPTKPPLPWNLSVSERNVFVNVSGTRTQFHVVEASTGEWIAAGGFDARELRKRYLRLMGTAGIRVEDLALAPVAFGVGDDPAVGAPSA